MTAPALAELTDDDGGELLEFFCPGCRYYHAFRVRCGERADAPTWTWNNDMCKPTFAPPLMVNRGTPTQCHLFVTDGEIVFLPDCHHGLRGQTVAMQPAEECA